MTLENGTVSTRSSRPLPSRSSQPSPAGFHNLYPAGIEKAAISYWCEFHYYEALKHSLFPTKISINFHCICVQSNNVKIWIWKAIIEKSRPHISNILKWIFSQVSIKIYACAYFKMNSFIPERKILGKHCDTDRDAQDKNNNQNMRRNIYCMYTISG